MLLIFDIKYKITTGSSPSFWSMQHTVVTTNQNRVIIIAENSKCRVVGYFEGSIIVIKIILLCAFCYILIFIFTKNITKPVRKKRNILKKKKKKKKKTSK
uniref:Uncharacterized protein n=1 Tax=Cacopsylla melanoneura TaxID=428564 RepID=A0A8D8ZMX7_9HEMI